MINARGDCSLLHQVGAGCHGQGCWCYFLVQNIADSTNFWLWLLLEHRMGCPQIFGGMITSLSLIPQDQGGFSTILKSGEGTAAFHVPTIKPRAPGTIAQSRSLWTTVTLGPGWNQRKQSPRILSGKSTIHPTHQPQRRHDQPSHNII